MDCATADREAIAEKYLSGELSENEREAFELHFFACQRCLEGLKTLEALRTDLQANRSTILAESARLRSSWRWAWAVSFAVVLITVGSLLWLRTPMTQTPSDTSIAQSESRQPATPTAQADQSKPTIARKQFLTELAGVQAPPYEPVVLRGTADPASDKFRDGMQDYVQGNYREAASKLTAAAEIDPQSPRIQFFLGASRLLISEDDGAIQSLQAVVALGDSPYLEESHFYLAKAWLRKQDLIAARQELEKAIRFQGHLERQARGLLRQLERLEPRSP